MDIQTERDGPVLTITLTRPEKKNAISIAMYEIMTEVLRDAAQDKGVRAILICGSDGNFTAGNDIDEFVSAPPRDENASVFGFLRQLVGMDKPIVAAVTGLAVGIGVTLLLHCDLVYASDTATFSLPFARLGLCPEAASSLLLPRLTGYQAAAEILMLGEPFDAAKACRIGIVNRVFPESDVIRFALDQAHKLADLPVSSIGVTKSLLRAETRAFVDARLKEEAGHFIALLQCRDAQVAFRAFFEKTKPEFHLTD
ncbi:enoyl-CoA hydratase [Burkholderia contaminans]|nr:enoyl-CoA hydratase [Burkholderia contaminans]